MNLNKKIAKTMVFALALGMLPFANASTAKAADPTFNNKTGILKLTDADKFWGVAKLLKKNDKRANVVVGDKYYKVTNIDSSMGSIDLTALGYGKNIFIAYGPKDELNAAGQYEGWKVTEVKAADKNFKAVYLGESNGKIGKVANAANALGGEFGFLAAEAFNSTSKKVAEVNLTTDKAKVDVQIGNSPWAAFDAIFKDANAAGVTAKLKSLVQKGASIKLRYAADGTHWYKEAKLKVAPQPKAPKVGVDVTKGLITGLKKDMKYALRLSDANTDIVWKTATATQKTTGIAETVGAGFDASKTYHLFAHSPAAKKKVISKISKVVLTGQTAPTLTATEFANGQTYKLINDAITIELDKKFDENGGATLTNDSETTYECFVNGAVLDNLPEKSKWFTLKGKKNAEAKPTKVKIKYNKSNKPNTYAGATQFTVLLRLPGTKLKDGAATLASAPVKAKVTFKKIEQATTIAGTGANNDDNTVGVNYTAGEGTEGTFTYTIANYQKFDKKPKLEVANKTSGVSLKVDNFDETTSTATVSFKLDKKATGATVVQKLKLSAEGAEPREITITFTKTA